MTERANEYFLRGDPGVIRMQLVEVSHPAWENTYRYVQNIADGVTVTHEDGAVLDYAYSPIIIKKSKTDDNLDQSITVTVGDLGEQIPLDMDRLRESDEFRAVKPTLNYREYLSDNLSEPLLTIEKLEVTDYQPHLEGGMFVCKAKEMNLTRTGISYTIEDFAALRDFI